MKLNSTSEWKLYCRGELKKYDKKPFDIPVSPNVVYTSLDWKNMKDWLGTSSDIKYLSYDEARKFVIRLNLKTTGEWKQYCENKMPDKEKKPDNIPSYPHIVYRRNGWKNIKHWLTEGLMSFEEAKSFVKELNLKNRGEWITYCKGERLDLPAKPHNIPKAPVGRYRKEWKGWNDWLNSTEMNEYTYNTLGFTEARKFVRSLGLKKQQDWKKYYKGELEGYPPLPKDIPRAPDQFYKDEYQGIADWLGYESKSNKPKKGASLEDTWMPFDEAKEFVHSLKLKSTVEWKEYCLGNLENLPKKPVNIPSAPNITYNNYGNNWISWSDWLGDSCIRKIKRAKKLLSFKEAKKFIQSQGLKSTKEWDDYRKGNSKNLDSMPSNIPQNPRSTYKNDGWISIDDWIGIK